jgi:hypothetical protein
MRSSNGLGFGLYAAKQDKLVLVVAFKASCLVASSPEVNGTSDQVNFALVRNWTPFFGNVDW